MKTIKKVIIFIISLVVITFALRLKNSAVLALLHSSFPSKELIKQIEQLLESFDLITWLLFITISLPFKIKKTSKVLCGIFGFILLIGILINIFKWNPSTLVPIIFNIIGLFVYFKMVNKFDFIKKIKDDFIIEMDSSKIIWQSAFYSFIYCCILTVVVLASVFSAFLLLEAPIWTILIVLPLAEVLVWSLLIGIFKSFGNYLIDRLNVHPSIIRSLYIYSIVSTIMIIIFYLISVSGPFSSGISFWRGMANIGIVFFAMRVFTVSILQFQSHISRSFQSAYAKKRNEFTFEDAKYNIDNESINKI